MKELEFQTEWFKIGRIKIFFGIGYDLSRLTLSLLLLIVSTCIIWFAAWYLSEDSAIIRFMGYLQFFVFSMLIFVNSSNYVTLLLGWEFIGLASFALINFWHTRTHANKGALKAIIYNRVGDLFLLTAIALMIVHFGTVDMSLVSMIMTEKIAITEDHRLLIEILSICIMLAAYIKSAQWFAHDWLLDAMEGPTPVSGLLHSATMVIAGLLLIFKSSDILLQSYSFTGCATFIGLLTMALAATQAQAQRDIKRAIAFSTSSQLGAILVALSYCSSPGVIFHLFTHGCFKSGVFMIAGSIIHANSNTQDYRMLNPLSHSHLFFSILLNIASFSSAALPIVTGYVSKHIVKAAIASGLDDVDILYLSVFIIISGIVAAYSANIFRVIITQIFDRLHPIAAELESQRPKFFIFLITAAIYLSALFGILFDEIFEETLFPQMLILTNFQSSPLLEEDDFYEYGLIETIALSISAVVTYFVIYHNHTRGRGLRLWKSLKKIFKNWYKEFSQNFGISTLYIEKSYNVMIFQLQTIAYRVIDQGILEILGPSGLHFIMKITAEQFKDLFTGYLSGYLLRIIVIFSLLFIGIFAFAALPSIVL